MWYRCSDWLQINPKLWITGGGTDSGEKGRVRSEVVMKTEMETDTEEVRQREGERCLSLAVAEEKERVERAGMIDGA